MAELVFARHLSKSFGATRALIDASFTFRPGEIHVLLGENGSGKSTTVNLLSGAVRPDSGSIEIRGNEHSFHSPRDGSKAGIATVHQDQTLVGTMTVEQNITLGHETSKRGWLKRDSLRAKAALERVHSIVSLSSRVSDLTLGQRQMVSIAKALSENAAMLILDEPTAALTDDQSRALFSLLFDLRKQGVAILYISHRLPEVLNLGDVVSVLKDGRVVVDREPMSGHTESSLIRAMIGRELSAIFPERCHPNPESEVTWAATGLSSEDGVLRDVSLNLRRGEIVGLAGLDGSGREALARIIGGVAPPSTVHSICVGDRTTASFTPGDRKSEAIVPMFSVGWSTTQSCLSRFANKSFLNKHQERQSSEQLRQQLGVKAPSIDARISSLSGGNQQKVVLARAICSQARIVVCEEPTAGVDIGARSEIYQILDALRQSGVTVLLSSSDLIELEGLADRVLVLRNGCIAAELVGSDLTEERILSAQY